MNLRQLYYFKTIAELEHYTRAAEALYVSQSSLSHAIRELETELHVKLFTRQGRNVKLSKHGELLYPHVKKALETLENGISQLQDYIDPNRGTVTLSAFPSLDIFVSDAIVQYLSNTGRVDVRFQYEHDNFHEIHQKLVRGDIDLAITTMIDDPRLEGVRIGSHRLVLLVPENHPFAQRESISLQDLDGENFTTYDGDSLLGVQIKEQLRHLNIRPNIVMEARQDLVIYGMVSSGHSVAITPLPLSGTPYNVKVLPISDDTPQRDLYLMWNKERYMPPAAGYFRDFIVKEQDLFDAYLKRCPYLSALMRI